MDRSSHAEARCIEALTACGLIRWDGDRFHNVSGRHLRVSGDLDQLEQFGRDRFAHIAESLTLPNARNVLMSNAFACSDDEFDALAQ